MPAEAVLTLTIVFGAYSFADGVLGLWSGYKNMRQGESWGWLIFSGLLGIATGLIVLVSPFVATLVLTVFLWTMVAFWSITSGVMEIVAAFRLRKEIEGEWLLVLSGVISILLGAAVTWVFHDTRRQYYGPRLVVGRLCRNLRCNHDPVGIEASESQRFGRHAGAETTAT